MKRIRNEQVEFELLLSLMMRMRADLGMNMHELLYMGPVSKGV